MCKCAMTLFTDEEIPVSDLGAKIIAFMLDNDNSFECSYKKRKEHVIAGTLLKFFTKSSWQRPSLSVH